MSERILKEFRTRLRLAACLLVTLSGCRADATGPEPLVGPALLDLAVTSGERLYPMFEPDVDRYSVQLADTLGSIRLTTQFQPTVRGSVNDTRISSGDTVQIDVRAGEVVRIEVRAFYGAARAYELVVVPPDFPRFEVTKRRATTIDARTFFTIGRWLIVVDDLGVPIFFRKEENRVTDFKDHADGRHSFARRLPERNQFGLNTSEIVILDSSFGEVEVRQTVGLTHTDNHDFLIRKNGNYVFLAYHGEVRDSIEEVVNESVIQEVTPEGEVVFEWRSFPVIPLEDALREWSDYAHINSVDLDANGDWIASLRGTSQVVKISGTTGQVVWRLGGKSNDFEFVDDPFSHLCGQHTARVLENGNLLIFDNGQLCWPEREDRGELTRVVEYEIDETTMSARLVWSYSRTDHYTLSGGSSQRLPNGNTLVGWSRGPASLATEVDEEGSIVWDIAATIDGESVRSYRAHRGRN